MRASLDEVAQRIRRFFSPEDEPLRRRIYGGVTPALTVMVIAGVITGGQATIIAAAVGFVLLIPVTEWARSAVTPARQIMQRPHGTGRHRAEP